VVSTTAPLPVVPEAYLLLYANFKRQSLEMIKIKTELSECMQCFFSKSLNILLLWLRNKILVAAMNFFKFKFLQKHSSFSSVLQPSLVKGLIDVSVFRNKQEES
jgi:hypothetical protein